jgi:dihydropyrimidinase
MSEHELVIRGGRVVGADGSRTADVAIDGERIAAVGEGLVGRRELDAGGLLVIPGAVDAHVHMRTEGAEVLYEDTYETGSIAAAFGGVTTIVDQAQIPPGVPLREGMERRLADAQPSVVDYGIHVNLREPSLVRVAELAPLAAEGFPSVKLFMAYEGYALPDDVIYAAMREIAGFDGLAVVHAENWTMVQHLRREAAAAEGETTAWYGRAMPGVLEAEATHRALALARLAGARTLVFHLSAAEAVEELRRAREREQEAYGEALVHTLLLDDAVYDDPELGRAFRLSPPLRGAADREVLWAALAGRDLDIVSTDHGPRSRRRDERGRLVYEAGTSGIEVRLSLVHSEGVLAGRLSLERWVEVCCTAPARILGLERKGRLEPGCDADVVLFDPERDLTLSAEVLHSAVDHSTYEGRRVRGWPRTVLSRGEVIVDEGQLLGRPGRGRLAPRAYG